MDPAPAPVRPFGRTNVGAPTGDEAAAFDRAAIEDLGVPQSTLMENAGRAAAHLVQRRFPRGEVVALVGAGNNGGDALVLLRTLAAWGRPVRALLVADRERRDPVLHGWDISITTDDALREDPRAYDAALEPASVLIDGILGTGIRGAPRERQAAAIRALDRQDAPIVSLDIPSGVDAGTGETPGAAVSAAMTVAFGWPKLGTLLPPGRERAGRLVAVEIGFPPEAERPSFGARITTPAWAAEHRPRRGVDTHKYRVGSLLLLAGREGMAGAAVMAALAALRSGVGLLRVASDPANRVILQQRVPEAVFVDASDRGALESAAEGVDALAAGPAIGLDDRGMSHFRTVLEASGDRPAVLDADALTLIGEERGPSLGELGGARPVLLTPHVGEMRRISGHSTDEIREDPVTVARETAQSSGCTVLLKGLPSLVAPPEGPVMIDDVGSSALATGGMGDVLTGACGSFLAQGAESPVHAGALGLHHSGRAAARTNRGAGLTPTEVVEHLPDTLNEEGPGTSDLDVPFLRLDLDPPR